MGYLLFDKNQLINLEYSLSKEILRTNRSGSFASSTIIGCNTRKYHGLLVCPCSKGTEERFVLLSTLDLTVCQYDQEFNLGIHKYQGDLFIPRGHKYVRDYEADKLTETIYRVGSVVIKQESVLTENNEQILLRYTLLEAQSPVLLKLRPFLAYRKIHELSKANMFVNTKVRKVENGIASRMYEGMPYLYMQLSRTNEYVHNPDWYYNVEYSEEQKRGYEFKEDLFVPGYFEVSMKEGESMVFSASTRQILTKGLKKKFTSETKKRIPRDSYRNCLLNAAEQFFVKRERSTEIIAGYPWFGTWGRDTFISLPGLALTTGNLPLANAVIDTMVKRMKGGLFPNMGSQKDPAFNSVDAPLWFVWSLQQYEKYAKVNIWQKYGKNIKAVLEAYRKGTTFSIRMLDNGLIYAGEEGKALTWMDAVNHDGPVTPRIGMPVEINALWYNAVSASLQWAEADEDAAFLKRWKDLPSLIRASFIENFWSEEKTYLADYVDGDFRDFSVRPNMLIAASMEHNMLTEEMKNSLLKVVKAELLTRKGIRTLSPKHRDYRGIYEGDQNSRDAAYHQGTVWPWLLEHFVKAYLDVHKQSGISLAKKIFLDFEEDMYNHGIGSVSEIYDGDPPHYPRGAISQAWSVAALLRINEMIENTKE